MIGEESVRLRNRGDKNALKEKVDKIKNKMKETEASQQRKQNALIVLKPFLYIVLLIFLVFVLYLFFNDRTGSKEDTYKVNDDNHGIIEEVEEIIAEVEGE